MAYIKMIGNIKAKDCLFESCVEDTHSPEHPGFFVDYEGNITAIKPSISHDKYYADNFDDFTCQDMLVRARKWTGDNRFNIPPVWYVVVPSKNLRKAVQYWAQIVLTKWPEEKDTIVEMRYEHQDRKGRLIDLASGNIF